MAKRSQGQFKIRPYRDKRLDPYFGRMSKDNLKHVWDDNVSKALEAQGFAIPEQPRSIYRVEKLFDALYRFEPGKIQPPIADDHYRAGIALAWKCFGRKAGQPRLKVMPLNPRTVDAVTSNNTGSAGLTAPGTRKSGVKELALMQCLRILKREKCPEPCLAFTRTSKNDKTRLVWGYPYSMTIMEGCLAKPMIERFKGGGTPMAFAMTSMALGVKIRSCHYKWRYAYSLDMSSFDASISAELIHQAFMILKSWFDLDEVEPVSGVTVGEIFSRIENYFIKTPIVMPDGNLYTGKIHGVPSGSYWTQLIDSVVNVIIIGAVASRFHLNVNWQALLVLGDDILFFSNRRMNLNKIGAWATKHFGVRMHGSEKSSISARDEAVPFLGRNWINGVPHLDLDQILAKMAQPEKFRKYIDDPLGKERQVRMLILAYAAEYYEAWSIASQTLNPKPAYMGNGGANIDVNTYIRRSSGMSVLEMADPEHLTGRMRFIQKFIWSQRRGTMPHTATQFWL